MIYQLSESADFFSLVKVCPFFMRYKPKSTLLSFRPLLITSKRKSLSNLFHEIAGLLPSNDNYGSFFTTYHLRFVCIATLSMITSERLPNLVTWYS